VQLPPPLGTQKLPTIWNRLPASVASPSWVLAPPPSHMALPLDHGDRPEILQNGDAFLKSFLKDIDGAQRSINMMTYIWKDGRFSDVLLDHLERRQRAGVQVRLLVDAYGSIRAPISKFDELEKLGGKIIRFHSLMPLPWTIMRNTKRNHRRSIVVDGTIGYTGGIATDDVWLGDARDPSQWHDLMFRVDGSMARRLQGSFAELWAATTGEVLQGPRFYPAGSAKDGFHAAPQRLVGFLILDQLNNIANIPKRFRERRAHADYVGIWTVPDGSVAEASC